MAVAKNEFSFSYEQGIQKLEEIIKTLEKNEIPLDQALAMFEEGIGLVNHCNGLINRAEQKMKVLLQTADQFETGDYSQTGDDIDVSR